MTGIEIVAPWAGYKIGCDAACHGKLSPPSLPADDYVVPAGVAVKAIAAGTIQLIDDVYNTIEILLADGRKIVYEENRTRSVKTGQKVTIGTVLGTCGLVRGGITRWPHIHGITAAGVRVTINEPGRPSWVYSPPKLAANQRVTKVASNVRVDATTAAAIAVPAKPAGTVLTILSYKTGATVSGNAVWFQIATGQWVWSGDFTSTATTGIRAYVAPAPPVVAPPVASPVIPPPVTGPVVTPIPPVITPPTTTDPVTPSAPVTPAGPSDPTSTPPETPSSSTATKPSTALIVTIGAIIAAIIGALVAVFH